MNSQGNGKALIWKAGLMHGVGKYKEYDLVKVEDGLLYYGERPSDGSAPNAQEKRAKGLQVPLKKRVTEFSMKF